MRRLKPVAFGPILCAGRGGARRDPLCCDAQSMSQLGQSETPNHVRDEGSFPPKQSLGAGDGCAASHSQPRLLLMAELAPISDAGAGDPRHLQRATNGLMHRSKMWLGYVASRLPH